MSESISSQLIGAANPEHAIRMAWLGNDHSPLVESALNCLTTLSAYPSDAPKSLSSRRRLCEELGDIISKVWNSKGNEFERLAEIKKRGPASWTDWLRALDYVRVEQIKIETYKARIAYAEEPLIRAKSIQRIAPEGKRIFVAKIKPLESNIDRSVKKGERINPVSRLEIEKAIGQKRGTRSVDYIVKTLRSLGYQIITTGKRGRPRL